MNSRTVVTWYWTATPPKAVMDVLLMRRQNVGQPVIPAVSVRGLLRQSAIEVVSELGLTPEVSFRLEPGGPAVERLFDEFARFRPVVLQDAVSWGNHSHCSIDGATGAALPGSLTSFDAVTRVRLVGESVLDVPPMLLEAAVSLFLESLVTVRAIGLRRNPLFGELHLDGVSRDGDPAIWKRGHDLTSCFVP